MPSAMAFGEIDRKCINAIRILAAEMVQKANSGHPGAPMGLAPLAHVLFTRFLRCNPTNPLFVLSNGHACALQYVMLHLMGYDISVKDLEAFRQIDSKLPGHPESHITPGIEVTTGPLGQGVANAVGLAIAEAHMAATLNPSDHDAKLFDNYTFVILGDGCMMEGIAGEASSLAGHLKLGKLIYLYDDNAISIDGGTDLAFSEDVDKRFEAYGFHCQCIADGDHDLEGIAKAIEQAQQVKDRPSLIRIKTTIGFGSARAGTEKVHGAPLGVDDLAAAKERFGMSSLKPFSVPSEVASFYADVTAKNMEIYHQWDARLNTFSQRHPELAEELMRRLAKKLPDNLESLLPRYEPESAAMATRKLSENVLNAICPHVPEIMGGSADLTHSNLTKWKDSIDFQANGSSLGSYAGRYLRFGVREHAMFGICNGLAAYGGIVPFSSTFLNFISYGWGSVRLSALSHQQVLYIMTHDSIGLGEDGPTHQPIETLAGLRALPNMLTFRPADGNEVSGAYLQALQHRTCPSVLCLSRQNLPQLRGSSIHAVSHGAYILQDGSVEGKLDLILVATGSEVAIIVGAAEILQSQHRLAVRVVSMPCWELFDRQSSEYRRSVLLPSVPIVSVEALSTLGWQKYAHVCIGMTDFGLSGPYQEVYRRFGFTPEAVAAKALCTVEYYRGGPVPNLHASPF